MVTLCLAGPEAERKFCCSIDDGSHRVAYEMAREYLARRVSNPLQAVAKTREHQKRISGDGKWDCAGMRQAGAVAQV
jgi:hypothetical protein